MNLIAFFGFNLSDFMEALKVSGIGILAVFIVILIIMLFITALIYFNNQIPVWLQKRAARKKKGTPDDKNGTA